VKIRVVGFAETEERGNNPAEQRAADPEQCGQDQSQALAAGEDRLGDDSREQAEHDPADDAHHASLFRRSQAGCAPEPVERRAKSAPSAPSANAAPPTMPAPRTSFRR